MKGKQPVSQKEGRAEGFPVKVEGLNGATQNPGVAVVKPFGTGEKNAISSNLSSRGRSDNRRVEITLRRIPDGAIV